MSALLPLSIQKMCIEKDVYHSLPEYLIPIAKNYDHVYKLTITPKKSQYYKGIVRVVITAPANFRENVIIENIGRIPPTPPPENEDDLRPVVHYVFGSGSIRYRGHLMANPNVFVETVVVI